MGENRLFWPQEMMDEWIVDEKASIEDDLLTIIDEKVSYKLSQAVHFVSDVGDGEDQHKLIGKVKELSTLMEMGCEHYMDSVLIEDSAYQVVQGFTGVPIVETSQQSKQKGSDSKKQSLSKSEDSDDRELLANFLLDNL
ncbi:MAG: hypothetical protein JXX29_12010 [Deltaproteobacteria bacterium]|nr:hypothetical protein [Deltaproteobacteria bacterium]MBN2672397.1 hypothetical protein [Deltaproteobacteria bacterium]